MKSAILWFKTLLAVLLLAVLLFLTTEFLASNTQLVVLNYLDYQGPELAVSVLVLLAFIIGALLGVACASVLLFRFYLQIASLRRKLKRREVELKRLHESVIKVPN